jgi:hypothetical protein
MTWKTAQIDYGRFLADEEQCRAVPMLAIPARSPRARTEKGAAGQAGQQLSEK